MILRLCLKLTSPWLILIGDLYIFLRYGVELLPSGGAILGLGGIDLQPPIISLLQFTRRLLVELINDAILQLPHSLLILQLLPTAVLMHQPSAHLQLRLRLGNPGHSTAAAILILLHEDHVLEVHALG